MDWIERFGFGPHDRASTSPARARARAAARAVVGLDDRQRADRPGHRGDADADGVRVRGGRERRRLDPAAPRRAGRRPRVAEAEASPAHVADGQPRDKTMLTDVVARRATGDEAAIPGYTRRRQDGHRAEAGRAGGYSTGELRRVVRRHGAGAKPRLVVLVKVDEPRGAIFGGVVAAPAFARDREVRPPVPRDPAGRAEGGPRRARPRARKRNSLTQRPG